MNKGRGSSGPVEAKEKPRHLVICRMPPSVPWAGYKDATTMPSVVRCSMDRRHPHCDTVVDEFMTRRPSFPWPVSASGRLVLGGGGTIPNSRCPFVFLSHGYGSIVIRAWVRGTVLLCYAGRRLPHLTKPIAIPRPSTIPDSSNRPQPDRQATNGERNCQTPRRCCWDMVVIRTAHYLLCVSLCLSDGIPLFDPWHGFA
ncbi:hypothetical protein AUP68_14471 [Ilyonectria robusta]